MKYFHKKASLQVFNCVLNASMDDVISIYISHSPFTCSKSTMLSLPLLSLNKQIPAGYPQASIRTQMLLLKFAKIYQHKHWDEIIEVFTGWKVSAFGVLMVRIFSHSDWIRKYTEYLSVFSPNRGKKGAGKLPIRTLFM